MVKSDRVRTIDAPTTGGAEIVNLWTGRIDDGPKSRTSIIACDAEFDSIALSPSICGRSHGLPDLPDASRIRLRHSAGRRS